MSEVERLGRPPVSSEKRGPSPLLSTRVDRDTLAQLTALGRSTQRRPSQLLREAIELLLEKHAQTISDSKGVHSDGAAARTLPAQLDELRGPANGTVTPPGSVAGATRSVYNLDNRFERAALYQLVIAEADRDDVVRFLNRDLLIATWASLNVNPATRLAWERRFPELLE